ncbi:hypothetical protein Catovirus_1_1034 [Catovirus CTV1]|uniref:Uncharacterized protein n=1 Tax=Catovirus CTV1 TaxID=1977631 RepID=A0A1V0SBD8_9VIRU|nr:hypothetical protein Catovirus_1_1034 [Catovirus CTV1]
METKKCKGCNIDKPLENFYFRKNRGYYESKCNLCLSNLRKISRQNPDVLERHKNAVKKYSKNNNLNEYYKTYRQKNAEKIKKRQQSYYEKNKELLKLKSKQSKMIIKEKIKNNMMIKPNIKNKICKRCLIDKEIKHFTFRTTKYVYESRCKQCKKEIEKIRRDEKKEIINQKRRANPKPKTPVQKICSNLRSRVNGLIKNREGKNMYLKLLGCQKQFLIKWFEYIFEKDKHLGMNWDNYGEKWQIDHVTPCAHFNLLIPEEQYKCFHWTNLCPVLAEYNLSKLDKIVPEDIRRQKIRVSRFKKFNNCV